ncbi:hypothetical protein JRO89_XS07G0226200 [Xanthoceras sorbifolium]|uniref:DUF4283 domain-containing protein n=1 Tax=Xanthoceras sorbifolium TaxID=99658 RepID=A0ABQ8HUY4_9ROSI|nr:hypothetical protein JRO89_XS07G0226200 [Xanthoceras sorbifolium]
MGGPWSFDGSLLVLVEPRGDGALSSLKFNKVAFWIQIHNIYITCMDKEIGWMLGEQIGIVSKIDVGATGDCIKGHDDSIMLSRYGRPLEYYFRCDRLGHNVRECPQSCTDDRVSSLNLHNFGEWLRAPSPTKPRNIRTLTHMHANNYGVGGDSQTILGVACKASVDADGFVKIDYRYGLECLVARVVQASLPASVFPSTVMMDSSLDKIVAPNAAGYGVHSSLIISTVVAYSVQTEADLVESDNVLQEKKMGMTVLADSFNILPAVSHNVVSSDKAFEKY